VVNGYSSHPVTQAERVKKSRRRSQAGDGLFLLILSLSAVLDIAPGKIRSSKSAHKDRLIAAVHESLFGP
jgi:hypothetical protein